jgi:hypothetical protein
MMSRSPLIQLVLVAMAAGVVILNIKPAVAEIRATQDDVVHYQEEIARVEAVNKLLTDNTNIINGISVDNTQALERYLPTKLDEIAILRDLEAITDTVGILPTALTFTGPIAAAATGEDGASTGLEIVSAGFTIDATLTYVQVKELLAAIEINDYQLSVESLELTPAESDMVTMSLSLAAYALTAPIDGSEGSNE